MSTTQNPTPISDFDRTFKNRLITHDPETLTEFFDTYFDVVFNRVHNLIRNRQVSEDLTQDIFLKIHKGLPRFDVEKSLKPWVTAIVNNHLRDYWRSQSTHPTRQSSPDLSESLTSPSASPVECLEQEERHAALRRAVYQLPLARRSVLLLRIYDGLSFVQIGRILDLRPGAARKRYSRAIGELRGVLQDAHFAAAL